MEKERFSGAQNVRYVNFARPSVEAARKNDALNTVKSVISQVKPSVPVYFLRPNMLKRAAKWFIANFDGFVSAGGRRHESEILYSVKSNPDEKVLRYLFESGLRHFDVASLNEIRLIDRLFGKSVKMYFMHPMKPREAISEAYFNYGIRDFSLDCAEELKKIIDETKNAKDLGLHLRFAIPNAHSAIDLSRKFGIRPSDSIGLIRKIRGVAKNFGICFHVGSQCMDPVQYRNALNIVRDTLKKAKVKLDVLDIGGGFPSAYPDMMPPSMESYIDEIKSSIAQMSLDAGCKIWCEPGRAMVAEAGSLLVRVDGKRGHMLYINDGTYGGMFDAGHPAFIYHCEAHRIKRGAALSQDDKEAFGFYGPTCDSLDVMKGPFYLPKNINEGDYIEIGQMGAYSKSIRTDFNGFNEILEFEVCDEPIESLYLIEDEALSGKKKL